MLGTLGRRAVELTVTLFALLGFFFVPLGRHTGFEHARAVFTTPAAGRAVREIGQAFAGLRGRVFGVASESGDRSPVAPRRDTEPKPVPPELD